VNGYELSMPVKLPPFEHQKKAFCFVLRLYGMEDGKVRSTGAALLMQMGTGKSVVSAAVEERFIQGFFFDKICDFKVATVCHKMSHLICNIVIIGRNKKVLEGNPARDFLKNLKKTIACT